MKVKEHKDGRVERQIVTAMIVDRHILAKIALKWDDGFFASKWANLLGGWCVQYHKAYQKAPGPDIEPVFQEWAGSGKADPEVVKAMDRFLSAIDGEYSRLKKDLNREYVLDRAGVYFNKVRLRSLATDLSEDLDADDLEKAERRLTDHKRVRLGLGAGLVMLDDMESVRAAFESRSNPIIRYPGAVGEFFGSVLERDAFLAFMGPEKRGKSMWLEDVAVRGVQQRRKVAFFTVGDMSEAQVIRRFGVRLAKHPIEAGAYDYPTGIERNVDERGVSVVTESRMIRDGLTWGQAWKAFQNTKKKGRSKIPLLRLSVHSAGSASVRTVEEVLQTWETEEAWSPDVIVLDYADILAPIDGRKDTRDQINETWQALRGLSQTRHCLLVTATQSDADSYDAETLKMKNFSGNKLKLAHVTGMVGINQTEYEKKQGVQRLNWIVLRDRYIPKQVYVAGCFAVANPCVKSTF